MNYEQLPEFVEGCIFCEAPRTREIMAENDYCMAFRDNYPISEGHTLVVPKRHVEKYFELSSAEHSAAGDLLRIMYKQLLDSSPSITGFNVGVNIGESAGQSIEHCHIHLIPRRTGDNPNPLGGVRCVIPKNK